MAIVTCPNCGAKNRVDESRAGQETPKCGRCGTLLSSGNHPLIITDDNFNALVLNAGSRPVLVDCWAAWCGPCRMIAPIVEQLATEAEDRWRIGKLDVDANPRTARQFRIDSIPTLLIFKNGKLIDTALGALPKREIEARLKNAE